MWFPVEPEKLLSSSAISPVRDFYTRQVTFIVVDGGIVTGM